MIEKKETEIIWEERVRYIYKEDIKIVRIAERIADSLFKSAPYLFGLTIFSGILGVIFQNEYFMLGAIPFSLFLACILIVLFSTILYLPYLDTVVRLYNKGWNLIFIRSIALILQISVWILSIILISTFQ